MNKKILFLGQLPPPHHGQSIMIENLVQQKGIKDQIIFLNLSKSEDINEVSKFNVSKVWHLFGLIISIFKILKKENIKAIYYPPSGDKMVPFIRDVIMLSFLRMFDKKIIFHFHSMGYKESYEKGSIFRRFLMERIYTDIDLCVCLSKSNLGELRFLEPRNTKIIPYGIEDIYKKDFSETTKSNKKDNPVKLLYLGNIYKSKGVSMLLDATNDLFQQGYYFEVNFIGGIKDESYRKEIENHPAYKNESVNFLGIKTGQEKWDYFNESDIFCFPTFYENENFPVVLIEAMQFGLPIISTTWRSIPEMVESEENGILVGPKEKKGLVKAMRNLIEDSALRSKMSKKSRERYLKHFTIEGYVSAFKKVFQKI